MTAIQERRRPGAPTHRSDRSPAVPARRAPRSRWARSSPLGPLTIDMYLPALPTITRELGTTSATVQLTLTGTLVGLGARASWCSGRCPTPSAAAARCSPGTALHVLASLLVLVAPNVAVLGALRVLQGVGAAAGAVIALAVVRDLYDGRAAATMLSRLFLVLGAAPVLAPTIGGEILRFTSWRGRLRAAGRLRPG